MKVSDLQKTIKLAVEEFNKQNECIITAINVTVESVEMITGPKKVTNINVKIEVE